MGSGQAGVYSQTQLVMAAGSHNYTGGPSVIPVVAPNSTALALASNKMVSITPGITGE